jgi:polar amino acid transport system substrate-binding protein
MKPSRLSFSRLRTLARAFLISCLLSAETVAKEEIKVGLAHFPPFIVNENGKVGGLAADLIDLLNKEQESYQFVAVPTLATTRHKIFDLGRYDMSMFDQLEWGWQGRSVEASKVFLTGGEVYIAQARPGRGQEYFDSFENKRMIGVEGYHYGFAGFNSDPDFLREHYNMQLTPSNLGSIQLLLEGSRGDIAVVTQSYLAQYFHQHPDTRNQILISERMDQQYQHRVILRQGLSLSIADINRLLDALKAKGKLDQLWESISMY